jgi:hypothetical protein
VRRCLIGPSRGFSRPRSSIPGIQRSRADTSKGVVVVRMRRFPRENHGERDNWSRRNRVDSTCHPGFGIGSCGKSRASIGISARVEKLANALTEHEERLAGSGLPPRRCEQVSLNETASDL